MNPISRMKELIPKILDADTAYYKLDAPVLSDREYDQLYDELLQLERDTGIILGSSRPGNCWRALRKSATPGPGCPPQRPNRWKI